MQIGAIGLIVGGIILVLWGLVRYRTESFNARGRHRADDFVAQFGATPEARFSGIQQLFVQRRSTLRFGEVDRRDRNRSAIFEISRHLSNMSPQELSAARIAATLYNVRSISAKDFNEILLGTIWGNGKATVMSCWSPTDPDVATPPHSVEVIDGYIRAKRQSSDGAVNLALSALEMAAENDPTAKLLQRELTGGGSAWLQPDELPNSPFTMASDEQFKLRLGRLAETGQPVHYAGGGSLITIAPPGAGKTQCQVLPNLALWPGAALVLDVKGDLCPASRRQREKFGPVYRFAPLDPQNSHGFNPLCFVRGDALHVWEDAAFLAGMCMPRSRANDPFWELRAHAVLTAMIADACFAVPVEQRSMDQLHGLVSRIGWADFLMRLGAAVEVGSMREEALSLQQMEAKTLDGVLQTLKNAMAPWAGERVRRSTRHSDWNLDDLRGTPPPTIFLSLQAGELDTFASVLRVFIGCHIRWLLRELPPRGAPPILLLLDEMPRMQYMPPVEEAVEVGRQYGLRTWMFAQNEGQIQQHYENARGLVGNCAVRMHLNPSLHDGTAKHLSEQIGERESPLDGKKDWLVDAATLAGPEYRDNVLVLASGCKPLRLRKAFAHEDPEILPSLDLPGGR